MGNDANLVDNAACVKPEKMGKGWRMFWILLIGLLGFVLIGCAMQRAVLWPSWAIGDPGAGLSESRAKAINTEVIWLKNSDKGMGTEVWFMKGEGVSKENSGGVVIFAHGNGELIDHWIYDLAGYRDMGISVALVEFRGYGRSSGTPSEEAIVADFVTAYDTIQNREDVNADQIIVHGRSIGGGIVAGLAKQRKTTGMILESTFTSVKPLAWEYWVPGFMVRDPLEVKSVLKDYQNPVLIIHGQDDKIIPVSHAYQNADAIKTGNGELVVYEGMSHNSPPPEKEYWEQIKAFLDKAEMTDP